MKALDLVKVSLKVFLKKTLSIFQIKTNLQIFLLEFQAHHASAPRPLSFVQAALIQPKPDARLSPIGAGVPTCYASVARA